MRFLVDECTGPKVAAWLRTEGHDVFSVYDDARGIDDDEVIEIAFNENRVLITNDKDFGEKVYREHRPHCGVVFLRLKNELASNKIAVLQRLLESYADDLSNHFVVASDTQVRFAKS